MSHMPSYIWVLAISAAIAIPGMTAVILGYGAKKTGGSWRTGLVAVAAVAAALGLTTALAGAGVYHGARYAAPWFGVIFAAVLTGALLASRLPAVRRAIDAPGMASWLEWPHALRIEGVVFLILMAQGYLPAVFALPAGIGDIAAGLAAPFVARRLARGSARRVAIGFALFGLADLVTALSIGFLDGIGPVRLLHGAASTLPLTQLPLVLIPTVAVPIAMALHIVSLNQIRRQAAIAGARQPGRIPVATAVTA